MSDLDEGVARLQSVLGGTRVNAERALRELHALMSQEVRRAERRAELAERRVAKLQVKLRRVRRRARRAQAAVTEQVANSGRQDVLGSARQNLRRARDRVSRELSARRRS